MGCLSGAIMAAFLALGADPFEAVTAALAVTAVAGEIAAETAAGPGSFVPAFLDQLYGLDAAGFAARARLF
jgi:hydroxyethylthiazole kinase